MLFFIWRNRKKPDLAARGVSEKLVFGYFGGDLQRHCFPACLPAALFSGFNGNLRQFSPDPKAAASGEKAKPAIR